jgi:hypothetical protein
MQDAEPHSSLSPADNRWAVSTFYFKKMFVHYICQDLKKFSPVYSYFKSLSNIMELISKVHYYHSGESRNPAFLSHSGHRFLPV